jgi:2-dehydro-3-deoxyphosphogluconate aldolase / (4S)-4-hydroxy-2-oxoglutarate aldolase
MRLSAESGFARPMTHFHAFRELSDSRKIVVIVWRVFRARTQVTPIVTLCPQPVWILSTQTRHYRDINIRQPYTSRSGRSVFTYTYGRARTPVDTFGMYTAFAVASPCARHIAHVQQPQLWLRRPWHAPVAQRRPRSRLQSSATSCCMCDSSTTFILPADAAALSRRVDDALARICEARLVLCVRLDNRDAALAATEAAVQGGVRVVEVTMTVPDAPWVMRELAERWPDVLVGAGTVLTVDQAKLAAAAGARFVLSPVTDAAVVSVCSVLGVLAVPGAATATEIYRAWADAGARLVKVFPVSTCGGAGFVRALGGPLGDIPLLPTSGIAISEVHEYLTEANVVAIGASHQILLPGAVQGGDWAAVTEAARQWVRVINESRRHDVLSQREQTQSLLFDSQNSGIVESSAPSEEIHNYCYDTILKINRTR